MKDIMTPLSFSELMDKILNEYRTNKTCFGIHSFYKHKSKKTRLVFDKKIETVVGPAAGPHTQLAQNIIASYLCGARFIELKTVQKLDGLDLAVSKPCIKADDEGYNCEWSTELYVNQAFDEYVKAYFAIKVLAKEWGLGDVNGFCFSMSVGYDLEGIKSKKIDNFIEGLKNAKETAQFIECKEWLNDNIKKFKNFKKSDLDKIDGRISNQLTISTLHGCPPDEIEKIASYILKEKHLHTLVKCNPTLLGYEFARNTLDGLGFSYVKFSDFHFKDDLQYEDAVPMFKRLQILAQKCNLQFGVKISNTFPVDVEENELPSKEMYMSGRALFPLSISLAYKLTKTFKGKLFISYSGGADFRNISEILETGILPVTVATTLLKPGGYGRLIQLANLSIEVTLPKESLVDEEKIYKFFIRNTDNKAYVKNERPNTHRKISLDRNVPYFDCFVAPCMESCPIHQDITTYCMLCDKGRYIDALKVILFKNPLPFITGTICDHKCMRSCTRNYYDSPIQIRNNKLIAATKAYDYVYPMIKKPSSNGKKIIVIGAGPAGISCAVFLARCGYQIKVFDKENEIGGTVRNVIPFFRISAEKIEKDVSFAKKLGVEFVMNTEVTNVQELIKKENAFKAVICIGCTKSIEYPLENGTTISATNFLKEFNRTNGNINLGEDVCVIGAGNTAIDAARTAKRTKGVKTVTILYRKTLKYAKASDDELKEAQMEGISFKELVTPILFHNKYVECLQNKIVKTQDGKENIVKTNERFKIPCSSIISAIGETFDLDFYKSQGIKLDENGTVVVDSFNQTSIKNVYVAGDCNHGASTVVNAIRDAQIVAEGISGKSIFFNIPSIMDDNTHYERKINIQEFNQSFDNSKIDKERCLACDYICENCVDVCPNRANEAINIVGKFAKLFSTKHQIIHLDSLCNECGNCKSFCPYNSAPYKDKFTYFSSKEDMYASNNEGFCLLNSKTALVKYQGEFIIYHIGDYKSKIDNRVIAMIESFVDSTKMGKSKSR